MARTEDVGVDAADESDDDPRDPTALRARLDVLEAENERLRSEYVRARRSNYRRTAFALAAVGVVAVLAAVVFPSVRDVLLSLGAIGLFGGVLTYYLTPERFVAADVGERVYSALAANETALAGELGLSETRVYVPVEEAGARVRLYVPHRNHEGFPDDLPSLFVVDNETRGVALEPTGEPLFTAFERTLSGSLADEPARLTTQLTDALRDVFEVVEATQTDVDAAGGRASVRVTDPVYADADAFDNPVASFLAVGYAVGLDARITVETADGGVDDGFSVTCRWPTDGETERDER